MDLLIKARQLESRIARTIDAAAQRVSGSSGRGALEVIHALLDLVEEQVVPAGRGRRVFPYNSVTVTLAAASPEARARYEVILDGPPSLGERVLERLRSTGADVSAVRVDVAYASEPQPDWRAPDFHVELARVELPVEIADAAPKREPISLQPLRGATTEAAYSLAIARIDIGRGVEVRDTANRLLRTNHIAFDDGADETNRSVSRRHAHISADDAAGGYRLHDDGSAHGTSVQRNGATIVVRSGTRGVRLRDGDEIVLGEARLRVSLVQ